MVNFKDSEIVAEYNQSAIINNDEFQMVKWGSAESMMNRFYLAESLLDFNKVKSVLDIGCGTGTFIRYLLKNYKFNDVIGIDISDKLIEYCNKNVSANESYICSDFIDFANQQNKKFDFISLVGVLQKTNHSTNAYFNEIYHILSKNGLLFITTKNIKWQEFTSGRLRPEAGHDWFDPDEVENKLINSGFKIMSRGGFIPNLNQVVKIFESHSIFFLVKK